MNKYDVMTFMCKSAAPECWCCFYQAFVITVIASAALTSKKKNPFTIHYLPNNGFMLQEKTFPQHHKSRLLMVL